MQGGSPGWRPRKTDVPLPVLRLSAIRKDLQKGPVLQIRSEGLLENFLLHTDRLVFLPYSGLHQIG